MMGTEKRQILIVDDVELNPGRSSPNFFRIHTKSLKLKTAVRRWNCWKRTMMLS